MRESSCNPVRIQTPLHRGSALMSWKNAEDAMDLVCSKWIFFIQNRTLQGLEEAEKHWDLSECCMEEVQREGRLYLQS